MIIKWFGHSCFQLTMKNGKSIVIDPYDKSVGYELVDEIADIVLVSHDIGTVLSMVKNIACVNETAHYHAGSDISENWLNEKYACPIELIGHGNLPHRVLKKHDDETCTHSHS